MKAKERIFIEEERKKKSKEKKIPVEHVKVDINSTVDNSFRKVMLYITDYGHMMAKSLILYSPNPKYHTRAVIYFYSLFEIQKRFFKGLFS